jgi:hypothetical protein
MSQEITIIRDYLNSLEHDFRGQPVFRIVFADDQWELRDGIYNEFKGKLFVRTIRGVKKSPKYPLLSGCWIIEMLHDLDRVQHPDIKEHNGYECLYAFRDGRTGRSLPPLLRVVQLIMKAKRTHISPMLRKSISIQQLEDKERKEDQRVYDAIDPSSPIESALHFKEGVSLKGLEIPGARR